ncbi:ATP-dependent Clp protease ATP-binding subunit, partial [Streptomyces sp. NPDC059556]
WYTAASLSPAFPPRDADSWTVRLLTSALVAVGAGTAHTRRALRAHEDGAGGRACLGLATATAAREIAAAIASATIAAPEAPEEAS